MHSTVQTGLYTPNIFGYDYNYHNHPPPPNAFTNHHHHPPRPLSYNPNKSSSHHNLNYQLAKHPPLSSAPPPSHHHQHHHHQHQQQKAPAKPGSSSGLLGNECDDNKSIASAIEPSKSRLAGFLGLASSPKRLSSSSSHLDRMLLDKKKQPKISPLAMAPAIKLDSAADSAKSTTSLCSCLKNSDTIVKKCSVCDANATPALLMMMRKSTSNLFTQTIATTTVPKKSTSLNCLLADKNVITHAIAASNNNSSDSSSQISYKANFVPVTGAIITTGASLALKKSSSSNNYYADRGGSSHNGNVSETAKMMANTRHRRRLLSLAQFKEFWQCTKPCVILTLVARILLLSFSVVGNVFSFAPKLCSRFNFCSSNPYLSIASVSSAVIGFVFVLVGLVIIVYSKKDESTQVIITSSKNMDKIDYDQVAAVTAAPQNAFHSTTTTNTSNETHKNNRHHNNVMHQKVKQLKQLVDNESASVNSSKARNSTDHSAPRAENEVENSRGDENEYNCSEEPKNAQQKQQQQKSAPIKIDINVEDVDESAINERTSCLRNEIV